MKRPRRHDVVLNLSCIYVRCALRLIEGEGGWNLGSLYEYKVG